MKIVVPSSPYLKKSIFFCVSQQVRLKAENGQVQNESAEQMFRMHWIIWRKSYHKEGKSTIITLLLKQSTSFVIIIKWRHYSCSEFQLFPQKQKYRKEIEENWFAEIIVDICCSRWIDFVSPHSSIDELDKFSLRSKDGFSFPLPFYFVFSPYTLFSGKWISATIICMLKLLKSLPFFSSL